MPKRHHWMLLLLMTSTCSRIWAAPTEGFGSYHPEKLFADSVSSSLYVPLRDGVRLAVRITRPALGGSQPRVAFLSSGSTRSPSRKPRMPRGSPRMQD